MQIFFSVRFCGSKGSSRFWGITPFKIYPHFDGTPLEEILTDLRKLPFFRPKMPPAHLQCTISDRLGAQIIYPKALHIHSNCCDNCLLHSRVMTKNRFSRFRNAVLLIASRARHKSDKSKKLFYEILGAVQRIE